jgi:hypothetical protein
MAKDASKQREREREILHADQKAQKNYNWLELWKIYRGEISDRQVGGGGFVFLP